MTSAMGKWYDNIFRNKKDTPASSAVKKRNKRLNEFFDGDAATFIRANKGANKRDSEDTKKNYDKIKDKYKHQD